MANELIIDQNPEELERLEEALNENEKYALNYFRTAMMKPGVDYHNYPLASDKEAELYKLYINGKTLSEIQRLNTKFSLGQIVYAYVNNRWAEKRRAYMDTLLSSANTRAVQAAAESVDFVADMMAAQKKYLGDLVNRYIQTNEITDELRPFLSSMKNYKDLVEMLSKLTGQDNTKTQRVSGSIDVNHNTPTGTETTKLPATKPANILAALASQKKETPKE